MDIHEIIKCDLDFVTYMSKKYDVFIPSWYWRLDPETETQWIERMVNLANRRQVLKGYLCGTSISMEYDIPVPFKNDGVVTVTYNKGYEKDTIETPYAKLYDKLEELAMTSCKKLI